MTPRRRPWLILSIITAALLCLIIGIRDFEAVSPFAAVTVQSKKVNITTTNKNNNNNNNNNNIRLGYATASKDMYTRNKHTRQSINDYTRDSPSNSSSRVRVDPWRVRKIVPSFDAATELSNQLCDPNLPFSVNKLRTNNYSIPNNYTSSYRSILEEFPPLHHQDTPLPIPLQILEDYRRDHSVESLRKSPGCRKFLVAHYRCPVSSGNRLHEFTNAYLWAVMLNRTLLWKYLDQPLCSLLYKKFKFVNEAEQCTVNNTIHDCDRVLERAPWIPSYDEWHHLLDLDSMQFATERDISPHTNKVQVTRGVDRSYENVQVLAIRPLSHRFDVFGITPHQRAYKLQLESTLQRVEHLFSMGHTFLFGLLFRSAFDIQPQIREQVQRNPQLQATKQSITSSSSAFSMVIHSRHAHSELNGCNITLDEACIQDVLQQYQNMRPHNSTITDNSPCYIAVMSDRPCTYKSLQSVVPDKYNCSVLTADHETGSGVLDEHGPFAGAGFFQDMALASSFVRDAVIGSGEPLNFESLRTSSQLLEELIEYHRVMEAWQAERDLNQLPKTLQCSINRTAEHP